MAVYTAVSDQKLAAFLADYDIGRAVSFKGIAEGVENSNYFLLTDQGPHILTLYEKRVAPEDLPYFLGLMEHLARRGLACPTPIHARDGEVLRTLCGRSGRRRRNAVRWAMRWQRCMSPALIIRRVAKMRSPSTGGVRCLPNRRRVRTRSCQASG